MPNCDFYAAGDDFEQIVDFILTNTSCRLFELSSEPGEKLREFRSFAELKRVDDPHWPPLLQLWPVSANSKVRMRRNAGDREELEGWGVIQLYLRSPRKGRLEASHTNHNSLKRAEAWAPTYPERPPPKTWDFDAVTRESSRLNRFIRTLAVSKHGSRVVLPGAAALQLI